MRQGIVKRFYTVAEAAELLRLSEPTLYRAIRAGQFPAIRIRGRYSIPAKVIDAMESSALAMGDRSENYYDLRQVG